MFGGPNPYYDKSAGPNVWNYYYEPIGVSPDELPSLIRDGKVFTPTTASELARVYRWEPESWAMNPYGYFRERGKPRHGEYPADWWQSQRERARVFFL